VRPKRLELPQWVQQQTKAQATETAALAEERASAPISWSGGLWLSSHCPFREARLQNQSPALFLEYQSPAARVLNQPCHANQWRTRRPKTSKMRAFAIA